MNITSRLNTDITYFLKSRAVAYNIISNLLVFHVLGISLC